MLPDEETASLTDASVGRPDGTKTMLGAVLALAFVMNMLGRGATEAFAVFLLPVETADRKSVV